MIKFEEDQYYGYKERTIKNASADVTIAIAIDFNTAGERLTKNAVVNQKNLYVPIHIKKLLNSVEETVRTINRTKKDSISLNIAGNGIYTLVKHYMDQDYADELVYMFLLNVVNSPDLKVKISAIRTGGQTGIDEAGAKAGVRLGIPTSILAPKCWRFRNEKGEDISDESLFKNRFMNI